MIKLVCFDFDGVFTDNKIYYDSNNNAIKYYHVKDGTACGILKKNNIKIGIISAFNSESIKVNDKPIQNIINHLKFDFVSIGGRNKLEIIEKWIEEMNISFNEVAYIGDDIHDVPVLKKVNISGCPNDAISECKYVSNLICKKNGGNGCVREFVDFIINRKQKPLELMELIKNEAIYQLNNFPSDKIDKVVNLLSSHKNNIYFTGIGKSENIAIHTANLLKCIGINAFYLNCNNSLHGDIGTIVSNDIVFLFSKSGNTKELIELLDFLNKRRTLTIGVCCNNKSKFHEKCNMVLELPFTDEIQGTIECIPTNSYMSQMFFCNILVTKLSKAIGISLDQYKKNHPAGNIGNNLKTINDILINKYPKIIFNYPIQLNDVLLEMTKYSIGCCFFVNENNKLIGLLTDGDIRRLLVNNSTLKDITINNINTQFNYETDKNKLVINIKDKKSKYLPLIDNDSFIGIIDCRII